MARADDHKPVGVMLPAWGVYLLSGLLVCAAVALPLLVRRLGWLRGEVPAMPKVEERALRPVLVTLPGGTFRMGSPESEAGHYEDEGPVHWVTVSTFEMCQTEVTQEQWEAVMDSNPSDCDYGCTDDRPVQNVSWHDAIAYLNRLTDLENQMIARANESATDAGQKASLTSCYTVRGENVEWDHDCTGYRLPTEAEWEYAARAGTQTAYYFGDDPAKLDKYAWYDANANDETQPVGGKMQNAWWLYDMYGNVWEWVWDWMGPYEEASRDSPAVNPRGPNAGQARVLRGGSFWYEAWNLRSADRYWLGPSLRGGNGGFRCARGAPQH